MMRSSLMNPRPPRRESGTRASTYRNSVTLAARSNLNGWAGRGSSLGIPYAGDQTRNARVVSGVVGY